MWEKKHEEHKQQLKAVQEENVTILENQPNVSTKTKKSVTWSLNPFKWRWHFSPKIAAID